MWKSKSTNDCVYGSVLHIEKAFDVNIRIKSNNSEREIRLEFFYARYLLQSPTN